jgi:hypothetical protein
VFFVSVASKWFTLTANLLFATLAERFISVAARELEGMVGSADPVGISAPGLNWSFDDQWTAVSEKKDGN